MNHCRSWHQALGSVCLSALALTAPGVMATPPAPTPQVVPLAVLSAEDVVRRIYTLPDPDFGVFVDARRRPTVYTPRIVEMAARMDVCYQTKYGMTELDFDFIVPGQDYDIRSAHVTLVRQTDEAAEVQVVLMNPDTPVAIDYRLRRIDGEWRVDDVLFFGGEASLAKTLAGPC